MAIPPLSPRPGYPSVVVPRHPQLAIIGLLVLWDLGAIAATAVVVFRLRLLFGPLDSTVYLRFLPALLLLPLAYLWAGLYPGYGMSPVETLRRTFRMTTLAALFLIAASAGFKVGDTLSRPVVVGWWLLTVITVPLVRALLRALLARTPWWGQPVIILGAAKTAEVVVGRLRNNPGLGLRPVACLDDDPAKHGRSYNGVPVIGPLHLAPEVATTYRISRAIVAMPGMGRDRLTRVVEEYASVFRSVIIIPDLLGLTSLWVSARDLHGVLALELQQNLLSSWSRFLKRTLDLALSVPALLLVGPFILLLGFLIKLISPGPAFYSQDREGLNGRRIRVWKLRTMVPDAEAKLRTYLEQNPAARGEWEQFFKLKNDPRIVPWVGHFLRRFSLDELPQLWNIVKDEMSLVGPRPFPDYHLDRFPASFRALRRRVPPGLSGLWQVSARSDGDLAVQEELDTYYIRNWSLWLDIYLLARTVTAVLFGKGAY